MSTATTAWNRCEAAMVVSRASYYLEVRWLASTIADPSAPGDFALVGGPVSHPSLRSVFRSKQPLLIGNDANLRAMTSRLEIDEVRLYDRALTSAELADIAPGQLSTK